MKRTMIALVLICAAYVANAGVTSSTTRLSPNVTLTWINVAGPKTADTATTHIIEQGEFALKASRISTRVEWQGQVWVVGDAGRWDHSDLSGAVIDQNRERVYIPRQMLDNKAQYLILHRYPDWGTREEQVTLTLEQYRNLRHFVLRHEIGSHNRSEELRQFDVPWTGIGNDNCDETTFTKRMEVPKTKVMGDWQDVSLDDGRMASHTSVITEMRYVEVDGRLAIEQLMGQVAFLPKGSKKMGDRPTVMFASPQGPRSKNEHLDKELEGSYYITVDGHLALVSPGCSVSFLPE
jgi:hypothetical protein